MDHHRFFSALLALSCLASASLISVSAEELPPDDLQVEDSSGSQVIVEDDKNVYHIEADTIVIAPVTGGVDDPLEVSPDDPGSEVQEGPVSDSEVLPDAPLEGEEVQESDLVDYPAVSPHALDTDSFPFYGSCWVKGSTPDLGSVTLFFPTNYKTGYIGLDNSGRLFNVSNNSWSGVLYVNSSGVSYTVNFGSFGLPTYRRYSGSSYSNITLYLTPQDGNIVFPDGPGPVYSLADLLPYLSILLLGGVFLCSMRRS